MIYRGIHRILNFSWEVYIREEKRSRKCSNVQILCNLGYFLRVPVNQRHLFCVWSKTNGILKSQAPDGFTALEVSSSRPEGLQFSSLGSPVPQEAVALEYEKKLLSLFSENKYFNVIGAYEEMRASSVIPTIESYDIILQSMVKIRQPGVVAMINTILDTYKSMLEHQLVPSVSIYSTLILVLCMREEEVYSQLQALNNKVKRGLSNSVYFQERINALKNENNLSMACEIFKASVSARFRPYPSNVYSELMRICALVGKTDELLMIYEQIINHNLIPNPQVFISLIRGFSKYKDIRSIVECFNEYKFFASKMEPHDKYDVYSALIDGYFRSSDLSGAILFFEKLIADNSTFVPYKILKTIIYGFSFNGDYLTAKSWIDRMKEDKNFPDPTPSCIIPVISAAIKANDLDVATELVDYSSSIGSIKPFGSVIFEFILLCLKHKKDDYASNILNTASIEGIRPDEVTTQLIAHAMIENGNVNAALELYKTCMKVNIQHFGSTRYIRRGFTLVGVSIMEELKKKGFLDFKLSLKIIMDVYDTAFHIPYPMLEYVLKIYFIEKKDSLEIWKANLKLWERTILSLSIRVLCFSIKQEKDSYACKVLPELVKDIMSENIPITPGFVIAVSDTLNILGKKHLSIQWEKYIEKYKLSNSLNSVNVENDCFRDLRPLSIDLMRDWNQVKNHPDIDFSISQKILNDSICHNKTNDYSVLVHDIYITYKKGKDITPEAYCRLLERLGKEKKLDLVNEVFKLAKNSISKNFTGDTELCYHGFCLNSMIIAQIYSGQIETAREYQKQLLEIGFSPSAAVFAAYIINLKKIDVYQEANDAMEIYNEAKSYNIELSTYFYNVLISKFSRARRVEETFKIFSEMKMNNILPNSITYGTIINACCRVENEELANELFIEMENSPRYYARVAPYNIMMQFYVHTKKNRQMALKYYEKLRNRVIAPSAHTYKLLIDCWTINDPPDINMALQVLTEMTKNNVPITTQHYGAIIYAKGCVYRDLNSARQYFDTITQRSFKPVIPDEILYQSLIEAYVANQRIKNTCKLLHQMKEKNIPLTADIANLLIHGWTHEHRIDKARKIFDLFDTQENSKLRTPETFEAMVRAYLSINDTASAENILEKMKTCSYSQAVVLQVESLLKNPPSVL
ncbi:uncharacterized protein T551_02172 [Pneumocystis jirovecii RU7]|uniref:Pentatricopeptide repeat-containing protein-mitochondrial domain-containing protein n=1 Tax=Pneumocystis jirovecii (strain RU7) TaxID=1408657 RepID=A0A0W4ZMG4_PNEJ7|nr:uncharacterized protein T551_02172 [Pneumocystis jirovecii RU7]KTW29556.1 hypothetical protein T551_02172 [Pneumocystis jirovecii RU7]